MRYAIVLEQELFMKWIDFFRVNKDSNLRLFCFHYAGGGASFYYPWAKHLPENIELAAIQLPGRETRFSEPLLKSMEAVINALFEEFKLLLDKPFVFFGHSVGALTCYELTRKLHDFSLKLPEHLIVSGCRAPHSPFRKKAIRSLPDAEFMSELMQYNGTPQVMLEHRELLELFLPIIRADFTISETYQYLEGNPFRCDITAINGREDSTVLQSDVQNWNLHTCLKFKRFTLPGDHFFIKSAQREVFDIISGIIEDVRRKHA